MTRHFKEVCPVCKSVGRQCPCNEPNKTVVLVTCDDCRKKVEEREKASLDDLQAEAEKLVALLKDRRHADLTWYVVLGRHLWSLHDITGKMLVFPSKPAESNE